MNTDLAKRYHEDGMAVMSKPQVIVSLYERLITDLERATSALLDTDVEATHNALVHAQDIVHELNLALDIDRWDGGQSLRAIYNHVDSLLIEANVTKLPGPVRQCIDLLAPLCAAWQEAAATVSAERRPPATAAAGTVRASG